jgi:hypothetical protein
VRHLRIGTVAAVLVAGVALLGIAPASGGDQNIVNVDKVIVGDVPAGDFEIEVACNGMVNTLTFASDGSTGTQQLFPPAGINCVITEVDDLGADDVAFACTVVNTGGIQTFCDDDTTARFEQTNSGEVTFTVTNTFVEPPPPEPEPAAAAEVVAATPTFTG